MRLDVVGVSEKASINIARTNPRCFFTLVRVEFEPYGKWRYPRVPPIFLCLRPIAHLIIEPSQNMLDHGYGASVHNTFL